ncbi:MAG: DUF3368 domain-containing protein [Lachnospiraceae bacterium]|nr:DUF3368 domain-containing protein [Lachnospiraceae bacterium]
MIVISDTTPIISLLKAGHLEVLQKLFGGVLIPKAVFRELTENYSFQVEAAQVRECPFIHVEQVQDQKSVSIFRRVTGLDAGESESIVMAEEKKADLLLIDERKGRRVASQMGLTITGTIGILLHAFDEELLSGEEVETCLLRMNECGIRLNSALQDKVMEHISKTDI